MIRKLKISLNLLNLMVFLLFIGISYSVFGQDDLLAGGNKILSPSEEFFEKADGLAFPWRQSECTTTLKKSECQVITADKWYASHILTIYNENGSIWYQYSLEKTEPGFFQKNTKEGFLPFASHVFGNYLRMVSESPNWYKVEINEETQETKYISKSDPTWAKKNWDHFLTKMRFFNSKTVKSETFNKPNDNIQPELFDKPNGNIIEESAGFNRSYLSFIKTDGDWAYVSGLKDSKYFYGWIRWREGRTILVRRNEFITINQESKK